MFTSDSQHPPRFTWVSTWPLPCYLAYWLDVSILILSAGPICLVTWQPHFKLFITCLCRGSICRGNVHHYDAEGAHEDACSCCGLLFFKSLWNTISLSNNLDPDQDRQNVGPDLGPNCLQRLLADNKSRC